MPKSCRCILDRMVFKGAMTKAERDKIVRNLKTQNEERKTGRWIRDRWCSNCGWSNEDVYFTSNWTGKYCPECGARMEGAEDKE